LLGSLPLRKLHKLGDTGHTSGATDDNFVQVALVDLGVAEDFLDGLEGAVEEVLVKLLKANTGDGSVEVDTLIQRVDLNGGLGGRREGTHRGDRWHRV